MENFSYSFLSYTKLLSVLFASIIGIKLWIKQRTNESLLLTCGILIMALGELKIFVICLRQVFMNDTKEMLEFADRWFPLANVVSSIGIIVTVIGFALITWKMKRHS